MCISFEVSVISYILGISLFLAIYNRNQYNDRWIAIFMIYVLHMQLLEAIMWKDQSCIGYNQMASSIAYFFTILQPLANYLAMMAVVGNTQMTQYVTLLMIPYFIGSIHYAFNNYPNDEEQCTIQEKSCHLEWKWLKMSNYWYLWLISVFIPFIALPDKSFLGLFPMLFLIISFILSFCGLPITEYISKPSVWCVLQVLMPMLILSMK